MPPVLRSFVPLALILAETFLCCAPAQAADWLTVASDRVRRVELDKSSITPSDAGTKVAWGRIVLSDEQTKAYGYRTVRALNRYDCRGHAFIIVKRVYLSSDENILREDKVDSTAPISVKAGTVDDRFFNEVCKPASVADLRETAKKATERMAAENRNDGGNDANKDSAKPTLRRADIQLARDDLPPQSASPAPDKAGKPADKAAPAKPEPAPALHAPMTDRKPIAEMAKDAAKDAAKDSASSPASNTASGKVAPKREVAEHSPAAVPVVVPLSEASAARRDNSAQRLAEQQAAERASARAAQQVALSMHKEMSSSYPVVRRPAMQMPASMTSPPPIEARDLHWSYEGKDGPENWGKLDPDFSVCTSGKRQSPIDIRDGIKVDQEPIQFDYKPSYFRIIDNGHTIQISYGAGSHITVMGRTYDLIQIHFHHPAEERIDGKGFAMVAHFVHRDMEGHLAIVAVLLESGQANSLIQTLWNNLPLEKNDDYAPRIAIQADDLLPRNRDYISYIGSLTTPPCTEGVLWLVMKQPMQLSAEQIDVFSRFYPNNARPIQASSGRVIKESR